MRVPQQGTWKQSCLASDLESVADAEDRSARLRVCGDLLHDWAEPRDGAGTQIVAVAETAREDDHIRAPQVMILVPHVRRLFAQDLSYCVIRVVIAVRAGESDDAELHDSNPRKSSSSVRSFMRAPPIRCRSLPSLD